MMLEIEKEVIIKWAIRIGIVVGILLFLQCALLPNASFLKGWTITVDGENQSFNLFQWKDAKATNSTLIYPEYIFDCTEKCCDLNEFISNKTQGTIMDKCIDVIDSDDGNGDGNDVDYTCAMNSQGICGGTCPEGETCQETNVLWDFGCVCAPDGSEEEEQDGQIVCAGVWNPTPANCEAAYCSEGTECIYHSATNVGPAKCSCDTPISCTDSDGGKIPKVSGYCESSVTMTGAMDFCTGNDLTEYYCDIDLTCKSYLVECNQICDDGACKGFE